MRPSNLYNGGYQYLEGSSLYMKFENHIQDKLDNAIGGKFSAVLL